MSKKRNSTLEQQNVKLKKPKMKKGTKETNISKSKSVATFYQDKCCGANNWKSFLITMQKQKVNISGTKLTVSTNQFNKYGSVGDLSNGQKKFKSKYSSNPNRNPTISQQVYENVDISSFNLKKEQIGNVSFGKQSDNNEPVLTKQIAIDCEMVGVEIGANKDMLARISLVNALGDCIYDKFVKPTEPVLEYRTHVSGVRPKDLKNGEDFKVVQEEVAAILRNRILVGHAVKNDLRVLFLSHPKSAIRDTSRFKRFREGRSPALKKLAKKHLGVTIQEGEHSSVQDALAAMQLYRLFKKEWENSLKTSKHKKGISKAKVQECQILK